MANFTPEQLNSMTLDELECYHTLDPTDVDTCRAYIKGCTRRNADLESKIAALEKEVYTLQGRLEDYE